MQPVSVPEHTMGLEPVHLESDKVNCILPPPSMVVKAPSKHCVPAELEVGARSLYAVESEISPESTISSALDCTNEIVTKFIDTSPA
jgi:hypothetical protein